MTMNEVNELIDKATILADDDVANGECSEAEHYEQMQSYYQWLEKQRYRTDGRREDD